MLKTESLNKLFQTWEKSIVEYGGCFVKDGIINEEVWDKVNPKIMFMTKEPNQYGIQCAGDFRDDWKNHISDYPFAYRIAEWTFGILNGFPSFDQIFTSYKSYNSLLQKISFINLKKSGGVGKSQGSEIGKHFIQNQSYLMQQIEIIDPDIIILCLSFDVFIRTKLFDSAIWTSSGYDINIAKWKDIKLIDFYHPSSRNGPAASYSLLQNVVQSNAFQNL
jgi:hypothetical protein